MNYSEFKNQPDMKGRSSREIDVLWRAYLNRVPADDEQIDADMQRIVDGDCNSFSDAANTVLGDETTKMGLGNTSGFVSRVRHVLRGF